MINIIKILPLLLICLNAVAEDTNIKKGLDFLNTNKFQEALEVFLLDYKKGNPDAGFFVGSMYEVGLGIQPSLAEAVAIYKESADNGSVKSKNRLGIMYMNGVGVLQNYKLGANLICDAAQKEIASESEAKFSCARVLLSGRGIKKDEKKALGSLLKMADNNHIGAINLLGLYYIGNKDAQRPLQN